MFLVPVIQTDHHRVFWFMFKVAVISYMMIWFRGTFPRFRYDQLMNIGWKYLIPIGIGSLIVNAIVGMLPRLLTETPLSRGATSASAWRKPLPHGRSSVTESRELKNRKLSQGNKTKANYVRL